MVEETRAVDSPAPEEGKSPEYDAFLSYAHRDRQVTTAIQKGLHQIGRRVGQMRALRVFRDDTNLTANPDLGQDHRGAGQRPLHDRGVVAAVRGIALGQ